jgi:hypothetical protein
MLPKAKERAAIVARRAVKLLYLTLVVIGMSYAGILYYKEEISVTRYC